MVAQRQQSTRQGQPSDFGAPSVVVQNLHEVATVRQMTRRGGGNLDQRPAQEPRTLLADVAPSDMTRAGSFRRRQARPGTEQLWAREALDVPDLGQHHGRGVKADPGIARSRRMRGSVLKKVTSSRSS